MKVAKNVSLSALMVCLVVLIGTSTAVSQTNFSVKIYAEDGSGWIDSVYIGKYTTASDAIGDSISPTLVENELPPTPPSGSSQAPDLRIVSPPGGPSYGQGVAVDIRHLVSDGQKNVYRLSFRMSLPEGSAMELSWPSGLGSVSGGGFYLTDGLGGFIFSTVDMSAQTSYALPAFYNTQSGGTVDIVVGDGSNMRTFTNQQIALAVDHKGKGKAEKRKPHAVDFCFDIVNPGNDASSGVNLALDFSMVCDIELSFPGDPGGRSPMTFSSAKKYTPSFIPALDSGQVVRVEGRGVKGSLVKTKYFFGNNSKAEVTTYKYQYLRMRMPNVHNVGEEIYEQGGSMAIGLSTQQGTNAKGKPIFRNISHPKYKDVQKTMFKFKNIQMFQDGPAYCLDTIGSKENIKTIKAIDPSKTVRYKGSLDVGNKLIGEMVALRFNILASAKGKTPSQGFGELVYTNDGHEYDGRTVNSIAAAGDSALSCLDVLPDGWDYDELADFLMTLNAEFSAVFDTVSFGAPAGSKSLGGTVATGVKPVALSDIFTGSGLTFAPVTPHDFTELYEIPAAYSLAQNYPNPFNPTTTIEFTLPDDAIVTLQVYNMLGQVVATLADREEFTAGENWVELDGTNLSTGVYYYRIVVNDGQFQDVRKMVLMK